MYHPKAFKWIVLVWLFAGASACSKEDTTNKQFEVGPFSKVNTGENVHVVISQEAQQTITAEGSDLNQLQVYVTNNELFVLAPEHTGSLVTVNITVPQLAGIVYRVNSIVTFPTGFSTQDRLQIDGRNDALLEVNGTFTAPELSIDIRDNALMTIDNLLADKLYLIAKNNNTCYISGRAERAQINLFNTARYNLGEGNFKAPTDGPLLANEYFVELRGQSQAWVHATTTLWVEAYDNCQAYYKGHPQMLIQNLHQGSSLIPKE